MDGPGLRTSIYFAGCDHRCPGCHNPQSWDFEGGELMTVEQIMEIVRYNRFPVTFTGGDPLYIAHDLIPLAREIRRFFGEHPEYLVRSSNGTDAPEAGGALWIYSGFRYEEVRDRKDVSELFALADVLVDGPFVESLKPKGRYLRFRGSTNQRFIDLQTGKSLIFD